MRPILSPLFSKNQRLPSGPRMIPSEILFGVGIENSVMTPCGVIRPILLPCSSINQRLPSGPQVIPVVLLPSVGTGNSWILPVVTGTEDGVTVNVDVCVELGPVVEEVFGPVLLCD